MNYDNRDYDEDDRNSKDRRRRQQRYATIVHGSHNTCFFDQPGDASDQLCGASVLRVWHPPEASGHEGHLVFPDGAFRAFGQKWVQELYDEGSLAFITDVGSLVEPLTPDMIGKGESLL